MRDCRTVCKPRQCAGCMACIDICPKGAIEVEDRAEYMDARVVSKKCISCGLCHKVCQRNRPAPLYETVVSYQGWADQEIRKRGSSGGFATAIMESFVQGGGTVASCKLVGGEFRFSIARNRAELVGFSGSKYVKSNPIGIYRTVVAELKLGQRVLFIGLPCQVSALRNHASLLHSPDESLFTVDLICHGTPSIRLLRMALGEYGYDLNRLDDVLFRESAAFGLRANAKRIEPAGVVDRYSAAFLKGAIYTENCYSCQYAQRDRVSDLTLGDSWGTDLSDEEPKGVSLALVQTDKGEKLLRDAGVELRPVDYENAVEHNGQLQHPSEKPAVREALFNRIECGSTFKSAVFAAYPKYCLKQEIKGILSRLGFISGGGYAISVMSMR